MSDEVIAMVQTLIAEVQTLTAEVRALREVVERPRSPANPATVALLWAIWEYAGVRVFTSAELASHAATPNGVQVHDAMIASFGAVNARKLGKLLCAVEGCDIGGLTVYRVGDDRNSAIWSVAPRGDAGMQPSSLHPREK